MPILRFQYVRWLFSAGLVVRKESGIIKMSRNHHNRMPAYKKIQGEIRDSIACASLKPGDAVASERELAKTHKVSLMTARHALAGLEHEGVVERRRGAGTFVAVPKIHFNKLMSYTEQMSSRGLAPRSRVLVAKVIEGDAEVVARLGLPAASRVVRIQRLRLTGEEPFALETCYLPAADFPDLASAPLEEVRYLPFLSMIMRRNWHMRTKKWMQQQRTPTLRNSSGCPEELRCCAFARLSIQPRARPRFT